MDWLDLLAVQGTLKSLLQHHNSKASVLQHSAFFIIQLSHLYLTTGKTIALTRWTFVSKVMPLLFNMLSRYTFADLKNTTFLHVKIQKIPEIICFQAVIQPVINDQSFSSYRIQTWCQIPTQALHSKKAEH